MPTIYTSAALVLPPSAERLDNALAATHISTYPYFLTWYGTDAQVGMIDLSGQGYAPGGTWLYKGETSTAALLDTTCDIYAVLPRALTPPPQFPGCDTTTYLAIPLPGSVEWCRIQDQIFKAVRQIGIDILQYLSVNLQGISDTFFDWRNSPELKSCGLTNIFDCITGGLKWIAGTFGGAMAGALHQIVCWIGNGAIRSDTCDPITYGALIAVKLVWHAIKNADVGSEVWIFVTSKLGDETTIPLIDRVLDYLIEYACPTEIPGRGEAIEAFLYNRISEDQYKCWMAMRGAAEVVWKPVLDTRREQLRGWEPIEWIRRQSLGDVTKWNPNSPFVLDEKKTEEQWLKDSRKALRNIGWVYQTDQDRFIDVYDELPTIAQHLHWLARNVDDVEYVAEYGLLDGFSTDADVSEILGGIPYQRQPQVKNRNFWATFGPELRAQGMRKIDAAREYAAHWVHGSPGQLQHFAWRLRPGRQSKDWERGVAASMGWPLPVDGTAPPQMVFTTYDYARILAEQDVAPKDVGWFASTIYNVPALSYLRDMYRYSIIDEADLKGYHLDLGYSEQDSSRFVAVDQLIKNRIRMAEAHGWTPTALSNAYALGMITQDEDSQWMHYLGFTDDETRAHQNAASYQLRSAMLRRAMSYSISRLLNSVLAAYGAGLTSADDANNSLSLLGIPADRTGAMLATVDSTRITALAKQTTGSIKRAYMRGSVTESEAQQILGGFLKNADVVQTTVDSWTIQRLANESAPTKADIKRYLKEGLVSPEEAQERLVNLGMKADNVGLILAEHQFMMDSAEQKMEAKRRAQEEKDKRAAQKQAEAQLKAEQKMAASTEQKAAALSEREQKAAARAEEKAVASEVHAEKEAQRVLTQRQAAQSRALVHAAREAEEMQARIVAALRKDEPPAKLDKWAQLGLIDKSYYTQRMSLYGYTEESIERSWTAACVKRTAACVADAAGQPGIGTAADALAAAGATTAAVNAEWSGVNAAEGAAHTTGP